MTVTTKIDPTAKIVAVRKDNPFREGTAVHKRARAVLTARTVEEALKKGARTSTIRHFLKTRAVRLVAPAKRAAA